MDSSASMKKTPNSLQQKFVSDSAKQVQLRTVEDARMVPLEEQAQAEEEGLNNRLQLTPMISGAKPSCEMGNEGNGNRRPLSVVVSAVPLLLNAFPILICLY